MNYKNSIAFIIFLIISSIHSFAQNHSDYKEITIDVDFHINSGEMDINAKDIEELKINNTGTLIINIYGIYATNYPTIPTPKIANLYIPFNSIQTSKKELEPIIIPPKRPEIASHQSSAGDESRVFLGNIYLFLHNDEYDIEPNDYSFVIKVTEDLDNSIVVSKEFSVNIYDTNKLGELTLDYAEIVYPTNQYIEQGYFIKSHISNSEKYNINDSAKVKYYYKKKDRESILLGTTIIEPLQGEQETTSMLFIDSNTYDMIARNQIKIIVDEDKEIFENNDDDDDNTIFYEIPKIQSGDTIKVYPSPFEGTLNFTFFISEKSHPHVILTIYDQNGNFRGKQSYIESPDNSFKTISYSNNSLTSGRYIYSLLVDNIQYYGTVIKK